MDKPTSHNKHARPSWKTTARLILTIAVVVLCAAAWILPVHSYPEFLLRSVAAAGLPAAVVTSAMFCGAYSLTAHLLGFRFVFFVFGPLQLASTSSGLRLAGNDGWQWSWGTVFYAPVEKRAFTKRAAAPHIGGLTGLALLGIIASALLIVHQVSPFGQWARGQDDLPAIFLAFVAGYSLLFFIVATLPIRHRGQPSPGAQIRMLLKGGPVAERWFAHSALTSAATAGIRPQDWDETWVNYALSVPDGSREDASANLLAYYWALDRGETPRAVELFDRSSAVFQQVAKHLLASLLAEAAFVEARIRKDPQKARELLGQVRECTIQAQDLLRAEAAILLAEGKHAEAADGAGKALAILDRVPQVFPGIAVAERDLLLKIIAESEQAHAPQA